MDKDEIIQILKEKLEMEISVKKNEDGKINSCIVVVNTIKLLIKKFGDK